MSIRRRNFLGGIGAGLAGGAAVASERTVWWAERG